jgi:hypothetical protein
MRADLLNPNVRQLWLGHWTLGRKHKAMTLYRIPRRDYRTDVETPSRWYSGQERNPTHRDLWQDVEETVALGSIRAIVAHYPYDNEPDAPWAFGDGQEVEMDWADPKVKDLRKSGLPIMMRIFATAKPTDVETELRTKAATIPCRVYLNGDPRVQLGEFATVLLLPERHLEKGTSYAVTIKGRLDGAPFERKWSFTTRKE